MAQLPCIGLYKPCINSRVWGRLAMYFDHGVNLFHCYFFSQVLQVVTWIDSQNWRLWIRAEIQDHPPKKKSRSKAAPLKMNGRNQKLPFIEDQNHLPISLCLKVPCFVQWCSRRFPKDSLLYVLTAQHPPRTSGTLFLTTLSLEQLKER